MYCNYLSTSTSPWKGPQIIWKFINFISGENHTQLKSYHQTSNISHTLVAKKIVDHTDIVGASPVGFAPSPSSFST